MNARIFSSALLFLAAFHGAHAAQPFQEFSKNISREFQTTAEGTTAIYNKYGQVDINTWAQNKVQIDIAIVVNANSQKEADRIFSRIQVNFTNTPGYVKAETVIGEGSSGSWLDGLFNWNSKEDFKINYKVWMPETNQLDLQNRYGDSYIASLSGNLTAEIKYGDLRAENIQKDADLTLGYGKTTFNYVGHLIANISYGELRINNSAELTLDSKYSNFTIEKSGNVRFISKYDDIKIGVIDDLRLQTKYSDAAVRKAHSAYVTAQYTDVVLDNIDKSVDADMQYGNMVINALGRNFSDINLLGKYTDFKLVPERGGAFRIEASGTYCDLQMPSFITVTSKKEGSNDEWLRGFVGDSNARGAIKAKLSYGSLILK